MAVDVSQDGVRWPASELVSFGHRCTTFFQFLFWKHSLALSWISGECLARIRIAAAHCYSTGEASLGEEFASVIAFVLSLRACDSKAYGSLLGSGLRSTGVRIMLEFLPVGSCLRSFGLTWPVLAEDLPIVSYRHTLEPTCIMYSLVRESENRVGFPLVRSTRLVRFVEDADVGGWF